MNQQDDSAGGSRSGGDQDAWRVVILGLLEKVDHLAAGLLGDEAGSTRSRGASGDNSDAAAPSDFSAQLRTTLETIIEEAGELIWQMLGQLIAILEAIQQALEQVMGAAPGTAAGAGGSGHRDSAYEPITVHFQPRGDPPAGGA